MKRRKFINRAAIGTTTAVAITACAQNTNNSTTTQDKSLPNIRWQMAASWPKSLDTIYGGAVTVCDRVKAMSGGRFQIEPFAAGEIVPGLEVMEAVQNGTVQCGHTASYYYIGQNPALAFATSVPFGLTASQHNAWLYQGGGLAAMQKIYSDFNIINFPAGNTATQMGGWFKRKVTSLSDLKGLKMRIPGLGGQVMSRLGVNVQVLAGGEVFLALERGAIDAAEWVGPYDDEKLGLNKAARYYYYPGWWEPGPTLEVQVNKKAWAKLPREYQEILKTAAIEANVIMAAKYDVLNGEALDRLIASGTQLEVYSTEIMETAREAAFDLYAENARKDSTFKEVYEQWNKFRQQILKWNKINELSFINFVANNTL